ncbi:hypothetical protein PMI05_02958 [Brevibacillus sp. BC25]|nr:hypothetical protein PMI05_02958 [Brevibacillus sp. BC25]
MVGNLQASQGHHGLGGLLLFVDVRVQPRLLSYTTNKTVDVSHRINKGRDGR